MQSTFSVHPQLADDTIPVGDLALSRVLLAQDANYPWLSLVPRRTSVTELINLSEQDQAQLVREIAAASKALKAATECERLNIAALGNVVSQLHVHVIGRGRGDAAWPKAVWGVAPPAAYNAPARDRLIGAVRCALEIAS
jgi:diadenosine tetraphosphate (Ap4A) HIT family hydrolase